MIQIGKVSIRVAYLGFYLLPHETVDNHGWHHLYWLWFCAEWWGE